MEIKQEETLNITQSQSLNSAGKNEPMAANPLKKLIEFQDKTEVSVNKIVSAWRCYTNKKIYRYYKDIIDFKCKGNPAHLLKAINPAEAQLLDMSANAHVRFRLGGEKFPPNIYYKIYTHGAICDVNSFAPRDYASIQKDDDEDSGASKKNQNSNQRAKYNPQPLSFEQYKAQQKDLEAEGWYLRIDNNGWRPISHKTFSKTDYVEVFTANKIKYYHFNKVKRQEKNTRKRRRNKLRWLQKIYITALKTQQLKESQQQGDAQQMQNQMPIQNQNIHLNGDADNQTLQLQQNQMMILNEEIAQRVESQVFDQLGGQQEEEDEEQEEEEIGLITNPFEDMKFLELDDDQFDSQAKQLVEWSEQLDFDAYLKNWFGLSTSNKSDLLQIEAHTNSIQPGLNTPALQKQKHFMNEGAGKASSHSHV